MTDTGSGTFSLVLYTRIIINIHVYILQNIKTRVIINDTRVYILPVSDTHVDVELVTRRAETLRGTSGPGAVLRGH